MSSSSKVDIAIIITVFILMGMLLKMQIDKENKNGFCKIRHADNGDLIIPMGCPMPKGYKPTNYSEWSKNE